MTGVRIPKEPVVIRNLIHGSWEAPSGTEKFHVLSPYTNQAIGVWQNSNADDVEKAVKSAAKAFPDWSNTPVKERARVLFQYRELLLQNIEDLAHIVSAESGKTIGESRAGIMKGVEVCEFALSLQNMIPAGNLEVSRGVNCAMRRDPLGVVAGIVPFNFPAMVPMWMYPIAIALGNTFVLKPSEKVPLTAQRLGQLFLDAELPPGVFNLVNGDRSTAEALASHESVRSVGFVGSTPAASQVYRNVAGSGRRCLALGGAKNHIIVTPDADPELTVRGAVDSFTGCAGQRCMAASLLVLVGDTGNLLDQIVATAGAMQPGKDMGAIIDRQSLERINGILDRADKAGARFLLDGRKVPAPNEYKDGNWLAPTIVESTPGSEMCTTEIFGPVLTVVRVNSLKEAMELENASPFGNAVSVFTTSGSVGEYVSRHSTCGMIGINIGVPVPREPFSFGGTKESKFGQGDITGEASLDLWSDNKKITTKWSTQSDRNWMS